MKEAHKIIYASIIVISVIFIVMLWHPWLNIDYVESIEDEFNDQLGITRVNLTTEWYPLGLGVHIYGYIEGITEPRYIGSFEIDLFGHTDVIHTVFGEIPAWW